MTGANTIPDEIIVGVGLHIKIHYMAESHDEANVIIVNRVMSADRHGYKTNHIVCDDTDVFVLQLHFYKTLNITTELIMVPTSYKPSNVAVMRLTLVSW